VAARSVTQAQPANRARRGSPEPGTARGRRAGKDIPRYRAQTAYSRIARCGKAPSRGETGCSPLRRRRALWWPSSPMVRRLSRAAAVVDTGSGSATAIDGANPGNLPADAGYIAFSSGSQGPSKGIIGNVAGVAAFLDWERELLGPGATIRGALLTSPSFGVVLRGAGGRVSGKGRRLRLRHQGSEPHAGRLGDGCGSFRVGMTRARFAAFAHQSAAQGAGHPGRHATSPRARLCNRARSGRRRPAPQVMTYSL
jgi:hypothetical protein